MFRHIWLTTSSSPVASDTNNHWRGAGRRGRWRGNVEGREVTCHEVSDYIASGIGKTESELSIGIFSSHGRRNQRTSTLDWATQFDCIFTCSLVSVSLVVIVVIETTAINLNFENRSLSCAYYVFRIVLFIKEKWSFTEWSFTPVSKEQWLALSLRKTMAHTKCGCLL